ncbi:MAG TPA: GNAT family N-acetyltransferase [Bacteroidales bacterium]|nr:GNAT family N-acetyltransferase [Bacteroidales bacterium]
MRGRSQMIHFKEIGSELLEEIKTLYWREGWSAYLDDDASLRRAFDNSLFTLGVFDDVELVGFIRCIGDGEHAVIIQDILVDDEHKRQGLGRQLVKIVFEKYASVRWVQVNTDMADERANGFYRSLGMKTLEQAGIISFIRLTLN